MVSPGSFQVELPAWCSADFVARELAEAGGDPMRLAIRLARENVARRTGGPFGAAIVVPATGELVSVGVNLVEASHDPLLHAECVAIAFAARALGTHSLRRPGPDALALHSSSEPCIMCLGAIHWSGIEQVVFAAPVDAAEAVGFHEGPAREECLRQLAGSGVSIAQRGASDEVRALMAEYQRSQGLIYNG